ncbi:hypothetical protein FOL47_003562 [Perkinsus chesapeaki]|uniref:Uncharacterized protein n=1 Tax=Perkinsus chesapeaki TaxID=330153 RepID=A0A7J6M7I5_PERCH|nr:hypothetical protein FOL47_003562 [Perkinsus chesapeaki]
MFTLVTFCRLLVLGALASAAPNGKYCGGVSFIFTISLTFNGDTFDLDGRYFFNRGSARNVPYSMPAADTIQFPLDNAALQKAFDDISPPVSRSELQSLHFANDQLTASTSLGSLTLTKGAC